MQRALFWALMAGGAALAVWLFVLPAAFGSVVYSSRPDCDADLWPGTREPDEVYVVPLVAGEEARIERPAGPHAIRLQSDGALISRPGDARASIGYHVQGCEGGVERVLPRGDGELHVSVWRVAEAA